MIYGLDVHKEFIQVCALGAKGSKRKEYRIAGSAEATFRTFVVVPEPSTLPVLAGGLVALASRRRPRA